MADDEFVVCECKYVNMKCVLICVNIQTGHPELCIAFEFKVDMRLLSIMHL